MFVIYMYIFTLWMVSLTRSMAFLSPLEEGETLAIVGESGSGKSVTVMSLLGLIPVPPGKVAGGRAIYSGANGERDLLKMSELELRYMRGEPVKPDEEFTKMDLLQMSREELRNIRGGQIGFVFQDPISSLNPILTIGEQVSEIITRHQLSSKEDALRRTIELLGHVGIPDPELRVSELSLRVFRRHAPTSHDRDRDCLCPEDCHRG